MKKILTTLLASAFLFTHTATAQETYAKAMIESQGANWTKGKNWDYVNGLVAFSLLKAYEQNPTAEWTNKSYEFAENYANTALNEDGSFKNFKKGNIDNIASGKVLFYLYRREKLREEIFGSSSAQKYKNAADFLHNYLKNEYPRIQDGDAKGCFFHKAIYPNQMWLDGLYMGAAFYAEYLHNFDPQNTDSWSDIAHQFITVNKHTYDKHKGLNYHAWSYTPEDANSFWARKDGEFKGCSQEFWGRGMGWFFAALVDVLEYMPKNHKDYKTLVKITKQVASGLEKWQDKSGVWYQLLQYDSTFKSKCGEHNYLEASASSMFTYAYLKGVRIGVLPNKYLSVGKKAYNGLIEQFITKNNDGTINLTSTCRSAGLGPAKDPSRDGTADYYLCGSDIKKVSNEGKAIGPFIMASLEYEKVK
ncbi:unsaturated rhamnogalacturonyl hydrolase [Bacteroidales bacterium KHT7]|nr:unsaturated rhamnogalacturonyl hydrolase [Bacteroidales bacterium KHT7]